MIAEKPAALAELLEYLKHNPKVTFAHKHGAGDEACYENHAQRVFTKYGGGGLWFVDARDRDREHYLPVNCGKVAAETGVEFFPDRFEFTKFNITFAFFYGDITQ